MNSCRCLRTALSLLAAVLLTMVGGEFQRGASAAIQTPKVVCPVTLPNGKGPGDNPVSALNYGNGQLAVNIWPGGVVLMTPSFGSKPGGPFGMKFPWWQAVTGELTISGRRLDAQAPPLTADIGDGDIDGEIGVFHPTGITFPTAGCWEVTGRVGEATLTFVTLVVEIREPSFGPALAQPAATPAATCPATIPNGEMPPGAEPRNGWHRQGDLWASLQLDGVYKMLGASVLPNGTYEWTMDWWRGAPGTLAVSGRRVDGPAPALGAVAPDMPTDSGYQAAVLFFPTNGCWQVTGTLGKTSLTVTMLVTSGP